ncbi:MAG: NYN domain-containing protein [Rhizomicrobium sp.]
MIEARHKYAMAFFDGQNLFQHAKDAFGHYFPNYDPKKLHEWVCASRGWKSNLVRFYTGVPDQLHSPMWTAYWSNRVLAMKRAGIAVTTRPLRYRDKEVEVNGEKEIVSTPQEKGIDVRIALDLVSCALSEQFDVAVIYSQDQDLCEAVDEVKAIAKKANREIEVACAFPYGVNATSKRGIDRTTWIKIEEADYNACLDPHDYRPKQR